MATHLDWSCWKSSPVARPRKRRSWLETFCWARRKSPFNPSTIFPLLSMDKASACFVLNSFARITSDSGACCGGGGGGWPGGVTGEERGGAVEGAAAGLVVVHPSGVNVLVPAPAALTSPARELPEPLTPREREVLQMISAGLGNKEIAGRLSISEHTVKFHVASILGKLGASTRTEAVSIGIRHALVLLLICLDDFSHNAAEL